VIHYVARCGGCPARAMVTTAEGQDRDEAGRLLEALGWTAPPAQIRPRCPACTRKALEGGGNTPDGGLAQPVGSRTPPK
jgi:hypothetical protein